MANFWYETSFVLDVLTRIVQPYSDTGPSLAFTERGKGVTDSKMRKWPFRDRDFATAMDRARPRTDKHIPTTTNMPGALSSIFEDYINSANIGVKNGKLRKFTLIIFTDGTWSRDGHQLLEVRKMIKMFMENCNKIWPQNVTERRANNQRPVSIQFIQFGDDEEARLNLRYLDNSLPFEEDFRDIG